MVITAPIVQASAAVVSAIILAIAATVAFWQLRNVRHSNELNTLVKFAEWYEKDTIQDSLKFIWHELPALLQDATFCGELENELPTDRRKRLLPILNFFDDLGSYVFTGALSEGTVLFIYGYSLTRVWNQTRASIKIIRRKHQSSVYDGFEDLAMRAREWARRDWPKVERKLRKDVF